MKNILFLTILFMCLTSNAQEFKIEEKSIIGIFEIESKNKADLFTSINDWFSINSNLSKNFQINDLESGRITIKGINDITYKSLTKALYPDKKNIPEYSSIKFNHLIEIIIKDNSYKIIYKIVDIASENSGKNNLFFNCINLNHTNEIAIQEYNEQNELFLEQALVEKNKIKDYSAKAIPMFKEINNILIFDLKQTMVIIEKFVSNPEKIEM